MDELTKTNGSNKIFSPEEKKHLGIYNTGRGICLNHPHTYMYHCTFSMGVGSLSPNKMHAHYMALS